MPTYTPDDWELLVVTSEENEVTYKIIGTWYGGYLGGDSWKISSGIKTVVDQGTYWELSQYSGSTYNCFKTARRLSGLGASVLANFKNRLEEVNVGSIDVSDLENLLTISNQLSNEE